MHRQCALRVQLLIFHSSDVTRSVTMSGDFEIHCRICQQRHHSPVFLLFFSYSINLVVCDLSMGWNSGSRIANSMWFIALKKSAIWQFPRTVYTFLFFLHPLIRYSCCPRGWSGSKLAKNFAGSLFRVRRRQPILAVLYFGVALLLVWLIQWHKSNLQ